MIKNLEDCLLRQNVPYSVYANFLKGDSLQDILSNFCGVLQEVINEVNTYTSVVTALKEWIENNGLQDSVNKKLEEMINDGTFDNIINQKIFAELSSELSKNTVKLDNLKILNVLDFNCTNDGKDISLQLNKMFKNVTDNDVIYFPKGEYKFNDVILENVKGVTIKCDGLITGSGYTSFNISNCDFLKITGFKVDGKQTLRRVFLINNCKYSTIEKINIKNIGNDTSDNNAGIDMRGDCSFSTLDNITIDNVVSSNVSFGIGSTTYNNIYSSYVTISNCKVSNILPKTDSDGIKILHRDVYINFKIFKCYLINCSKRGIKIQGKNVNIDDCYVKNGSYSGIDFQDGEGVLTNTTIEFSDSDNYIGVALGGGNVTIDNVQIKGNDGFSNNANNTRAVDISKLSTDSNFGVIKISNMTVTNFKMLLYTANSNVTLDYLIFDNCLLLNYMSSYPITLNNINIKCLSFKNNTIPNPLSGSYFGVITGNMIFDDLDVHDNNVTNKVLSNNLRLPLVTKYESVFKDSSNYPYFTQINNKRIYYSETFPQDTGGDKGTVFNKSLSGDVCFNIGTTRSETGWYCTGDSSDVNPRGVWAKRV